MAGVPPGGAASCVWPKAGSGRQRFFAAVAGELPGELAPKLALAACLEDQADGQWRDRFVWRDVTRSSQAARYYTLVAATDPGFASASFGLARVFMVLGDREGAVAALQRIPRSSSAFAWLRSRLCRAFARSARRDARAGRPRATSQALSALAVENSVRLPLVRDLHHRP